MSLTARRLKWYGREEHVGFNMHRSNEIMVKHSRTFINVKSATKGLRIGLSGMEKSELMRIQAVRHYPHSTTVPKIIHKPEGKSITLSQFHKFSPPS